MTFWQCEFQTLEDVELSVQMEEVVLLGVFGGGGLARIQGHAVVSTVGWFQLLSVILEY